jgi:hypothetical protein
MEVPLEFLVEEVPGEQPETTSLYPQGEVAVALVLQYSCLWRAK